MRGRRVRRRKLWIVGGVEEGTNHSYMVPRRRRRAVDLLPPMRRHVHQELLELVMSGEPIVKSDSCGTEI